MDILKINIWNDDGDCFIATVWSYTSEIMGMAAGDTPEQALSDAWANYFQQTA